MCKDIKARSLARLENCKHQTIYTSLVLKVKHASWEERQTMNDTGESLGENTELTLLLKTILGNPI